MVSYMYLRSFCFPFCPFFFFVFFFFSLFRGLLLPDAFSLRTFIYAVIAFLGWQPFAFQLTNQPANKLSSSRAFRPIIHSLSLSLSQPSLNRLSLSLSLSPVSQPSLSLSLSLS